LGKEHEHVFFHHVLIEGHRQTPIYGAHSAPHVKGHDAKKDMSILNTPFPVDKRIVLFIYDHEAERKGYLLTRDDGIAQLMKKICITPVSHNEICELFCSRSMAYKIHEAGPSQFLHRKVMYFKFLTTFRLV
jgi:hypothetical protein